MLYITNVYVIYNLKKLSLFLLNEKKKAIILEVVIYSLKLQGFTTASELACLALVLLFHSSACAELERHF